MFSGAFTIAQRVFGLVAGLLAIVLLARALGPSDFGFYSIIISASMLASIAAQFGLPNFLLREIASSTGPSDAAAVMAWGNLLWIKAVLYFAIPLWIIGVITLMIFEVVSLQEVLIQASIFFAISITGARIEIVCEALKGMGVVALGSLPSMVVKPGGLLVAILISLKVNDLTLYTAMIAYLLSNLAALVVSGFILSKYGLLLPGLLKRTTHDDRNQILRRQHQYYRSMRQFAMMSFSHRAIGQVGIQVLGLLGMPEQAGLFRFAMQLNIGAEIATQTVNSFSSPRLAQTYSRGDLGGFSEVAGASAWVMTFLVGGYIVALCLLGGPLVNLLIGEVYIGAMSSAFTLAIGTFIASLFGSSYVCLIMTRHEQATGKILAVALIASIFLTLVASVYYGALGAAIVHAAIVASIAILSAVFAKKATGVRSDIFAHLSLPLRRGVTRRLRSERQVDR